MSEQRTNPPTDDRESIAAFLERMGVEPGCVAAIRQKRDLAQPALTEEERACGVEVAQRTPSPKVIASFCAHPETKIQEVEGEQGYVALWCSACGALRVGDQWHSPEQQMGHVSDEQCPFVNQHDEHKLSCPISIQKPGEGPFDCMCPLTGEELEAKYGFEPVPDWRKDPFVRPMGHPVLPPLDAEDERTVDGLVAKATAPGRPMQQPTSDAKLGRIVELVRRMNRESVPGMRTSHRTVDAAYLRWLVEAVEELSPHPKDK